MLHHACAVDGADSGDLRATPSGTVVPPVLVDAYLENSPYDRHALERAMVAEELATFVFQWPP